MRVESGVSAVRRRPRVNRVRARCIRVIRVRARWVTGGGRPM